MNSPLEVRERIRNQMFPMGSCEIEQQQNAFPDSVSSFQTGNEIGN
jgi:hypothetical protein